MKSVTLLFLTMLCFMFCFAQQKNNYRYGISFNSHTSNLDNRTSLNLNPNKPFTNLSNGFSLSFDVKLRKEVQTFGYIFRMIVDEKSSFDFLSNLVENEFNFVLNDHVGQLVAAKQYRNKSQIVADVWIPITATFYNNRVEILVNHKKVVLNKGLGDFKNIEFYFGANKTKYFHTTEVPPISLRNIKLTNDGSLIRHWIMGKHRSTEIDDELEKGVAKVDNGIWEIDQHVEWKKNATFSSSIQPQIAFDEAKGRIFIVAANQIFIYHVNNNQTDTIKVLSGNPFQGVSRQIIYNPKKDELLSYTIQSQSTSSFSFKTNSWSASPTVYADSRQHHNHFLDTASNTLNIMMGYGYHKYDSGLMQLNLNNGEKQWESYSFSPNIYPRYLSALGVLDQKNVLLLGGFGSKSGRQEEFPHNFYDLYKIDPTTGKNTKLWELNIDTPYIVFSNSMHIDTTKNKLFVLGYNNFNYKSKILLYGFDINTNKPSWQIYGTALPFNFLDIESYCDLFFDKNGSRLFALVLNKSSKDNYEVNLYSIAYPLFSFDEIHQNEVKEGAFFYVIGLVLLLSFIYLGYLFFLKFKKKSQIISSNVLVQAVKKQADDVIENVSPQNIALRINLFNGFHFVGKDNIDYSTKFTPILKQIFLYFLLPTLQKEKGGVSSQALDQTFWHGMQQEKAINNRSVNIRKLRLLLASIGDIEIANKNGNWVLNINESYICDYQVVMSLLKQIETDGLYTKARIEEIIKFSKGKLLVDIENDWIDPFKSDFTSLFVKILLSSLKNDEIKTDDGLRLKVADVILMHDSLEENAIIYKCNLLYKTGQKGISKHAFDKYCSEYQQTLNASSGLVYNEIINLNL